MKSMAHCLLPLFIERKPIFFRRETYFPFVLPGVVEYVCYFHVAAYNLNIFPPFSVLCSPQDGSLEYCKLIVSAWSDRAQFVQ